MSENNRPGVPRERGNDAPELVIVLPSAIKAVAEPENIPEIHEEPTPPVIAEESEYGEWWEPMYTAAPETGAEQMYSPGLRHDPAAGQIMRLPDYSEHTEPTSKKKEKNPRRLGFWRAAALIVVCAVFSAGAALGITEFRIRNGDFTPPPQQVILGAQMAQQADSDANRPASPVAATSDAMTAQDIYDMALKQVVSIRMVMTAQSGDGFLPRRWNNIPGQQQIVSGSGFIISSDGYILTNFHVVADALAMDMPIMVYLSDGSRFQAEFIGHDPQSDVALIKIDAVGLTPVSFADSDALRVGQRVYAVGNPFGEFAYTMTDGIVSALDRDVRLENNRTINMFQISAAVNAGNSGGPVYDTNGDVIGIVTAKFMHNNVEGIGFAIPINDAIEVAMTLIEHGFIPGRPRIGITGQSTVTSVNADYFAIPQGSIITELVEGSAGEAAGLQVGDIIIYLGDVRVRSMSEIQQAMRRYRAFETTTITVFRNGEEVELTITFDEDLTAGQRR